MSSLGLTYNDTWPPIHLHGVLIHTSVCGAAPLQRLMLGSRLRPHQISSSNALSDTVQAWHVKILMIFRLKELKEYKSLFELIQRIVVTKFFYFLCSSPPSPPTPTPTQ